MKIDRSDALNLFRKWRDEKRVITCIFNFPVGCSYTLGQIVELTDESVTISSAGSRIPLGEAFSAKTVFRHVLDYDYIEGRHVSNAFPKPQKLDALLTLSLGTDAVSAIGFAVMPDLEELLKQ